MSNNCNLEALELATLQTFSATIDADVFDILTLEGSVAARNHIGGTAPKQVEAAAQQAVQQLRTR